jgi:hypothetical protein
MHAQGIAESVTGSNLQFSTNPWNQQTEPLNFPHIPDAMHNFATYIRPQTPLYNMWGNDNNQEYTNTVVRTENQIITTQARQNEVQNHIRPFQYHNTGPRGGYIPIYPIYNSLNMIGIPLNMQLYRRNAELQVMLQQQQNYIVLQQQVMALQQQVHTLKLGSIHQPTPVRFIPIEQPSGYNNLNTADHEASTSNIQERESADLSTQCMGLQTENIYQDDDEDDDSSQEFLRDFSVLNSKQANCKLSSEKKKVREEETNSPWHQSYKKTEKNKNNSISGDVHVQSGKRQQFTKKMIRRRQNFRNCQVCQLKYNSEQSDVSPQQNNGLPNQLAIYLMGPIKASDGRKKIIFVLNDIYSNWSEFHPQMSKETKTVCHVLYRHFRIHGAPETILVEDAEFLANSVQNLLEDWNVKQLHISEAKTHKDKNLKDILSDFLQDKHWEENLKLLQHSINSTPCESTGITPAELFLGQRKTRKMLNRCDVCSSDPSTYEHANEHTQRQILNIHEFLKNHESKPQEDSESEQDKQDIISHDLIYKPDDLVLVWFYGYENKAEGTWKGPFKVLTMIDSVLVKLQDTKYPFGIIQRPKVQIKPYREEDLDEPEEEKFAPRYKTHNKNKNLVQSRGTKQHQQETKQYKSRKFRSSQ